MGNKGNENINLLLIFSPVKAEARTPFRGQGAKVHRGFTEIQ
jgi:hypothetical protein